MKNILAVLLLQNSFCISKASQFFLFTPRFSFRRKRVGANRCARVQIFSPDNKKGPADADPFFWRRRRDLNPRDTHAPYSLSRGAPSASWVLLHRSNYLFDKAKLPVCLQWRRGWDSNPCGVAPKRFSRPPRYDHFDTSPGGENRAVARELYYHDSRGVSTAF